MNSLDPLSLPSPQGGGDMTMELFASCAAQGSDRFLPVLRAKDRAPGDEIVGPGPATEGCRLRGNAAVHLDHELGKALS